MARKQMPWFRLYTEMPTDRKVRRLKPEHRWLWVCILCLARQSPTPGTLLISDDEPCTLTDIADFAGLSETSTDRGVGHLARLGMIEGGDPWNVSNWDTRQFQSDTSTDRVRSHRKRSKQPSGNDDETLHRRSGNGRGNAPETETETEGTYTVTTDSRVGDPPAETDQHPPDDRGSDLWARRLAATIGKHTRLTDDQLRIELLTAWHDNPHRTDADLIGDLEARTPA